MKKVILLLIIIIFLTGCGNYFLDNFIIPDDKEFLTLIKELDTPEKIDNYMEENFEFELHLLYTPDPYILWKTKKGDCNDFSTFGVFIANYHGYKTYQIEIFLSGTVLKHWIAIYSENNGFTIIDTQDYISGYPKIIDNQLCFPNFNSFEQIVKYDSLRKNTIWLKYIVYDYDMNIIEEVKNN
jgi:hypothetical protein